jgi:hypothetical protein
MKTTLQVPMEKQVKKNSEKIAHDFGYSSLQELVRVFLKQFSTGKITPSFSSNDEFLTSEEEAILNERYLETKEDIQKGKGAKVKNANQLLKDLNGD